MLGWLSRFFGREPKQAPHGREPNPALEMYERAQREREADDSLLGKLKRNGGRCPDCSGDLLMGPEGGCAVNVECDACGHRFNIGMAFGGPFFVERIGVG